MVEKVELGKVAVGDKLWGLRLGKVKYKSSCFLSGWERVGGKNGCGNFCFDIFSSTK